MISFSKYEFSETDNDNNKLKFYKEVEIVNADETTSSNDVYIAMQNVIQGDSADTNFLRISDETSKACGVAFGSPDATHSHVYYNFSMDALMLGGWGSDVIVEGDMRADTVFANVYTPSDKRLKENLKAISRPTESLEKLNGYSYTMDGDRRLGLIAQEVKEIFPEAIKEFEVEDETYLSVDYDMLIPVLLEAIKDLNRKVKILSKKVD